MRRAVRTRADGSLRSERRHRDGAIHRRPGESFRGKALVGAAAVGVLDRCHRDGATRHRAGESFRGIAIVRNRPSRTAPWSPKQRRDPGRSEHKGSRRIKGALRHQRYARAADGSHRLFPSEQGPVYATNCPSVHDLRARGRPHPAGRPHAWGLRGPRVKPSGDEVTLLGDVVAPVIDVQASAGAAARRAPVQRVLPLANVTTAPMHAALHIPVSVTIRELDRGVA